MHDADQRAPLPSPPSSRLGDVPSGAHAAEAPSGGPTGDAAVDQALTRLAVVDDLPVRDHVAVFDAVHTALQARLADVED